jgi:hypothetical protein
MAEVAGLVLGAIALIGPTYQGYAKCEQLFKDIRYHTKALRSCAEAFLLQKVMFQNECELLLRIKFSPQVARAMLDNPSHPNWTQDPGIHSREASPLKTAVFTIQQSLDKIEKKLLGVLEITGGGEVSSVIGGNEHGSLSHLEILNQLPVRTKSRYSQFALTDIA